MRYLTIALFVAVGTGFAQYIADSMYSPYRALDFAYSPHESIVYISDIEGVCALYCPRHEVQGWHLPEPRYLTCDTIDNRGFCAFGPLEDESLFVFYGTLPWRDTALPLVGAVSPVWDPVANRVYVACGDAGDVAFIDCRNRSVITRIPTGLDPWWLDLSLPRRKLYVRHWQGEAVSIIDLDGPRLIKTIQVGAVPMAGYYSPSADKYYCIGEWGVVVISGSGDSIIKRIRLPAGVRAMTGVESRGLVMVAVYGGVSENSVYSIDTRTDSIVAHVDVGMECFDLAWSPLTGLVYCATSGPTPGEVSVIAEDGSRVVTRLRMRSPQVLLPVPEFREVYVGGAGGFIYVIRDTVTGIEETEMDRRPPGAICASPAGFLVRGNLFWSAPVAGEVLDVCGRKVAEVQPGMNDLRHLAPGVYAVVSQEGGNTVRFVRIR